MVLCHVLEDRGSRDWWRTGDDGQGSVKTVFRSMIGTAGIAAAVNTVLFTTRRADNGRAFVMILEGPAATAIREAMDAVEDF
jgi:hypothetical protein